MQKNINTNPSLAMGLAMAHAEKTLAAELRHGDRQNAKLHLYTNNGAGYFFVHATCPIRWYFKGEPGSDHFQNAVQADVDAAITAGAHVQLVGFHGRSLALWRTWAEFENECK